MIVVLDTTIITLLITNPESSQEASECQEWLYKLLSKGIAVTIAEICDYETRRGILLLEEKTKKRQFYKLNELNRLRNIIEYLPFTEYTSRIAAAFWARATSLGQIQPKGISADILILAHAKQLDDEFPGRQIIIVTKNVDDFLILEESYLDIIISDWKNIQV